MKRRLTHINPIHAGKVTGALGVLYSLFAGAIFMVPVGIGMVTGNYHASNFVGPDAIVIAFMIPVLGFVYGAICAVVYNLIAKWTGGVEFTVADVAPR